MSLSFNHFQSLQPRRKPPPLPTMFEEDFERCFICQAPCKGLYCSSECRQQDNGAPSPASKPTPAPIQLTAQFPISLSPLIKPTHQISPRMPAHVPRRPGSASSASDTSSSPIHSPNTLPSRSGSPQKDVLKLPPPAFPPHQSLGFPGSMPVKIPPLLNTKTPSPAATGYPSNGHMHGPSSHSFAAHHPGTSIETLRFGRKPGLTNSVTSPNALLPRCACGKPANHPGRRSMSKDREKEMDSGFSRLSLGPSVHPQPLVRTTRIVSDSIIPSPQERSHLASLVNFGTNGAKAQSGHVTPHVGGHVDSIQTISNVLGASLLSRSRSDPISPSLRVGGARAPAPLTPRTPHPSNLPAGDMFSSPLPGGGAPPSLQPQASLVSPMSPPARRGRSRERHAHDQADGREGVLNQLNEREQAPSRSRHRKDERGSGGRTTSRSGDKEDKDKRERTPPMSPIIAQDPAQILPSWSRHSSNEKLEGGVAPVRRPGSGHTSPVAAAGKREEELKRANAELGRVFA